MNQSGLICFQCGTAYIDGEGHEWTHDGAPSWVCEACLDIQVEEIEVARDVKHRLATLSDAAEPSPTADSR